MKRKVRLEMDWMWLRACLDLNAQEKKVLSAILALALLGLAARHWWQTHPRPPVLPQTPTEEEFP